MRLTKLLSILDTQSPPSIDDPDITGVKSDSRHIVAGDLFVAVTGLQTDGHNHIEDAIDRGASAVVCERLPVHARVPCVEVEDSRLALPMLSAQFFDHPSKRLRVIGVTGTKGKTTVTNLIRAVLVAHGAKTGLFGTVSNVVCDIETEAVLTTPESNYIQKAMADMVRCGTNYAVMEVSSHALSLGRVKSCEFDTALFTNLSQDHLDYHETMEQYFRSKATLFESLGDTYYGKPKTGTKTCVLNKDIPVYERLRRLCKSEVLTYGIDTDADVSAKGISYDGGRSSFWLQTPLGSTGISLKLAGRINVYNALAAVAATLLEGVPLLVQKAALEAATGVGGRFERVDAGQKFGVIVDYAHSPDSLLNVLETAKDMAEGKVLLVFGCGGDRDKKKRPLMGGIAGKKADWVVLTNDNPRSEDPGAIIEQIECGIKQEPPTMGYVVSEDRREAIRLAIQKAEPGDVVLIAGKGHENYQIFGDRTVHFDDREEALSALESLRFTSPGLFESEV